MTVSELIEKLKEMPQDFEVMYYDIGSYKDEYLPLNAKEVRVSKERLEVTIR